MPAQKLSAPVEQAGQPVTSLPEFQQNGAGHNSVIKPSTLNPSQLNQADHSALSAQLARKERDLQMLAHRLAVRDAELARIKSSRWWKLMARYWQVKNEYVLPALKPFLQLLGINSPAAQHPELSEQLPLPIKPFQIDEGKEPGQALLLSKANAYDVICFPVIEWDFRFQRPQQLMSRFAAAGHRVFYLAHKFCELGTPYEIREKGTNIYEVTLCGAELNVYRDQLDSSQRDQVFFSLDALRRDFSLGATALVVQLPFWWPLAEQASAEFGWPIVYDCMDHHAGFSTNAEAMLEQEHRLFSSSDLVVVSSASLAEEAKTFGADPLLLRNACEYDHFAAVGRTMNARPVVGYYGAIADWFDSDLVADLARRRKDWDFVLVGSTNMADISKLIKLPNVSLTGEQPYATLPRWLTRFDATIIPFKRLPLTEATNPVKAYEILAAGKPLISVPLPEVAALGSVVRLASTATEFEREIESALKEDSAELVEQRRAFAKTNTWERRFQTLSPAIGKSFPQTSIVIVTYNNLDLNRLCLEKLYERTEWPNFEVIVVDNASTDGTTEYLKEVEQAFPNLRVVLNSKNLGFAAANNIGLKMATGEFLVLLNNDTVVTRGWLTAMLRHLQTDSGIGLIGPVTNAISNEAKIEVGYQQVEEMPTWAAGYVRDHDGETFPIPMLAMFCVAMRRQIFEEIGLLDEQFGIGMFEDDDYCRRASNLGYQLVCARDSFIHHWQRASFKLLGEDEYLRIYQENQRKFEEKWRHIISDAEMNRQRRQLCEIIARIQQSRGAVIFLPSIGWRVHLFQRPHHLAQTFARQGYVAIFDSSGSQDAVNGFEEIEHNLFLFNGPEKLLHEIPQPILWTLPYNFDQADKYPDSACKVYDWIDDLAVFPYDREFLESNHRRALSEASVVASVAAPLHKQALGVRPDAVYLPNGVEFEAFAQPERGRLHPQTGSRTETSALQHELDDWLNKEKPIAGYYGALASWFDYDLLDSVAEQKPDWNFLLIGQTLDESLSRHSLLNRTNVKWIGPREYASLPDYLQIFDVAMIPFVINEITLATSPLKLYEYLAGAKPVIATPMPECEAFSDVFIARNAKEFAQLLETAAARGRETDFQHRLQKLAQENSWTARVRVIEHVLESKQEFSSTKSHEESTKEARQKTEQSEPVEDSRAIYTARAQFELSPKEEKEITEQTEITETKPDFPSTPLFPFVPLSFQESHHSNAQPAPVPGIAERFGHFRQPDNERFFAALARHFSSIANDPCLPMYFEFAVTSNERGRRVAGLLSQHTGLQGKRYLDLGCAYAGFLVAFAEQGAEVAGVDNDDKLLNLARHNLQDHNLDVPLRSLDATSESDLRPMRGSFDIITCNDVIEHVDDPQALIRNIASLLTEDGLAYFEIPNALAPRHVLSDGHYQIFGITLLDYEQASEYFSVRQPGVGYSVRHYLKLEIYERMFAECGLSFTLLEESFEAVSLETIRTGVAELRASAPAGLSEVHENWRELIGDKLESYLETIESAPSGDETQQRNFLANYGPAFWRVLARKAAPVSSPTEREDLILPAQPALTVGLLTQHADRFQGSAYRSGRCNVCGKQTAFFYTDPTFYRESLSCGNCLTSSRYRSIARGILQAVKELTGISADSLAELIEVKSDLRLKVYDTQPAFYVLTHAYPIPDLLAQCPWIDVQTSLYRPQQKLGEVIGPNLTNQNLEALTFADNSFDIVITSDVMEHIRLDFLAHREIRRVLKRGGIYLFTVPHFRDRVETYYRVAVTDPADPTKDVYLTEKEFHGDMNSPDGKALSYRSYGTDLDQTLKEIGLSVDYTKEDLPETGILNTEIFYCRKLR